MDILAVFWKDGIWHKLLFDWQSFVEENTWRKRPEWCWKTTPVQGMDNTYPTYNALSGTAVYLKDSPKLEFCNRNVKP